MVEIEITPIKYENFLCDKLENDADTAEEFFDKCGELFIKRGTENIIFFCTLCGGTYAEDLFIDHLKIGHLKLDIDAEDQEDKYRKPIETKDRHLDNEEQEDVISVDSTNFSHYYEEDEADKTGHLKQHSRKYSDIEAEARENNCGKPIKTKYRRLDNEVQDDVILDSTNCAQYYEEDEENDWNEYNNNSLDNTANFVELADEYIINTKDQINNEVEEDILSDSPHSDQYCEEDNWNEDNNSLDNTANSVELEDEIHNEVQEDIILPDSPNCDQYEEDNNSSESTANFGELLDEENKDQMNNEVEDDIIVSDSPNCEQYNEGNNNSPENRANFDDLPDEDILNNKEVQEEEDIIVSNSPNYCEEDNWNEDNNSSENTPNFGELPEEDIPDSKLTCKRCHNTFECVKDLITHDCGLKKSKKDVHQCEVCLKIFPRRKSLYSHQYIHKIKKHSCEICGSSFAHKHNLNSHIRRHKKVKPFKCDFCDKAFVSSTEKRLHMGSHTGERKYVCEICGMGHMLSSNLRMHRLRHLGIRNFKCPDCDKSFYDAYGLRNHRATHAGAPRSFKCQHCVADFKTKNSLNQHSKIHDEVKSYSCKICFKKFAQHAGLYSHMKMHDVSK